MSLHTLRQMRLAGSRPALVTVLVGKPPKWLDDAPDIVVIDRDPAGMDLRPLMSLPVLTFEIQPNPDLLARTLDALEAEGVEFRGTCGKAGVVGLNERQERAMVRYRERLCME